MSHWAETWWCCWQSPLRHLQFVCINPWIHTELHQVTFFTYSCFFHLSYFSFVSYFIKQENPVLQLWKFGKGTCIYLWTFQSYTHPVIMMQAVSEHCIWCLSDAQCMSLLHSNVTAGGCKSGDNSEQVPSLFLGFIWLWELLMCYCYI